MNNESEIMNYELKKILESLQIVGLNEREAAAYGVLLTMPKGTALTVADAAGIKRPTAYLVLESLRQKKLVATTKFRGVKDYRALPLEHLKSYVKKQKVLATHELPKIQKLYNQRQFKLRLRVYGNILAVKILLEKSLRERSALHIIGSDNLFSHHLGAYWQFYIKRAQQLGIAPRFKSHSGSTALLVWHDKVAWVKFKDAPQMFAFRNKELHDLYQSLWNNY